MSNVSPQTPLSVMIIGAGTGGLCLAHSLQRAGIDVQVYERDRTRVDGLQGYRVGIDPHGLAALKAALPPELFATFLATCARTPRYFNMLTERMSELLSVGIGASEIDGGKSVSRMTLRQVLLTGLEDRVHFDKTFVEYEQHADGRVTARFADGTSASADVLVGADGARSKVRRQLLPHARLENTGIVSIAAKVPMTEENRALLPPKVRDGITLISAPKGYGAIIHVMAFDWDQAGARSGVGANDAALIERWPGLLYDNTRDYLMWGVWGVWGARRNVPADPMKLEAPARLALAMQMTDGWHPNLRALIRASDLSTTFALDVRTSVPVEPWPASNVTVLGDAIHLMTPGRGVGANTALRDAQLLGSQLVQVARGELALVDAIAGYETQMRRYGFHAVAESRKQFDERDAIHRPIVGRFALGAMRTAMRVVNNVPPLKRRMIDSENRFRGSEEENAVASH
ncbi:MAG TPA: NAD(P)/FAD-dependent oxidoreductase [Paraburkholderia sp.]|uniref:FAD-dependent oxidoreductase n=1 Tax=Paraburkholderia sp. TaxID=1926495 RepID=UPI002B48617C|nr:NAD(P)/FAD-dependent oxidoreductase [Paraburkholderia sp.]HKR43605.1 NAD(P)/FAD-dependent oxidoreductase [Paraburkholderia sp.]